MVELIPGKSGRVIPLSGIKHRKMHAHINWPYDIKSQQTTTFLFSTFKKYCTALCTVLVWAGVELSFFTVDTSGLWFGFVLQAVFIIHGVFIIAEQCMHRVKAFSTPPSSEMAEGCTKSWEETEPGQLTSSDPRDSPSHMAPCSVHRYGGRLVRAAAQEQAEQCSPGNEQLGLFASPVFLGFYFSLFHNFLSITNSYYFILVIKLYLF